MAGLKRHTGCIPGDLKASTLAEVLVASIIFLFVFTVSLDTIVRITSAENIKVHKYILILDDVHAVKNMYIERELPKGEYTEEFEWGEILLAITDYEPDGAVKRMDIEANIKQGNKKLQYTYLFETEP